MRAIGRGSISSILKVIVDIAWIVACALLGLIWIVTAVSLFAVITGATSVAGWEITISGGAHDIVLNALEWSSVFIGAMMIATYLRGVFGTLVNGDPFVPENAARLRMIGLIVAVVEIVRLTVGWLTPLILSAFGAQSAESSSGMPMPNLAVWFSVLTLLVLSQVFSEGSALREDQQMTI